MAEIVSSKPNFRPSHCAKPIGAPEVAWRMLFNSYVFIFLFVPITLIGYYALRKEAWARIWLVVTSLFFYSYWDLSYLPLLAGSILVNFYVGASISKHRVSDPKKARILTVLGVCLNAGFLIYYKYTHFFLENVQALTGLEWQLNKIVLPLAISFFTFQQIAFLVDHYKGLISEPPRFLNYALFVSFFPQLIAGPIVHHKEMMPQFADRLSFKINFDNLAKGLFVFFLGLFKKVAIADTFAVWATKGFDLTTTLTFLEAWVTSLSYTFQLYFDFSGYTDMAIGVALLFNITLPINFNSPYKADSIQDFWRRWHMTLSRWLRDYIYIPLGGNRAGKYATYINLMLTFLIGGFWHGAGWTFIFWGFLHGAGLVVHRLWQKAGGNLPRWLAVAITFLFANIAWVFFRAKTWDEALKVLNGMAGLNGVVLPDRLQPYLSFLDFSFVSWDIWYLPNIEGDIWNFALVAFGLGLCWFWKNTNQLAERFKPTWINLLVLLAFAIYSLMSMNKVSEFLYFQF